MIVPVRDRRRCLALLGLAVAIGCAVRLVTFTGTIVNDDLTHAWAATHLWDGPIEPGMPGGNASAYTVNARRVGVNLPLWVAQEVVGPSEWSFAAVPLVFSLLGILAVAAWAWLLVGPRAGVIAGWLWAVLPIDVWQATVWLQDNVFATVLAAGMAALVWAERDGRRLGWIAAGLALGYLQYVKESAVLLLFAVLVAGAVRSWRARALHRGTLWLLAGTATVHALAFGYFAVVTGDAFYYVKAWSERQGLVEVDVPWPFPMNLVRFAFYLSWGAALGLGLPIAVGLGVRWLRRDEATARVFRLQLAVLAALQLAVVIHVLRWGSWTMRYLLQATPVLVVIAACGLATAWPAATERARRALVVCAIATTALGLVIGHPQHGRFRGELAREAYAVITRDVPPDVPVYVVVNPEHEAHYTDRAFALFAGYHPRPGGWNVTQSPSKIARGVLVWSSYERLAEPPTGAPGRRLYAGETSFAVEGHMWIEVRAVGL